MFFSLLNEDFDLLDFDVMNSMLHISEIRQGENKNNIKFYFIQYLLISKIHKYFLMCNYYRNLQVPKLFSFYKFYKTK